jgi:hypothetical protein
MSKNIIPFKKKETKKNKDVKNSLQKAMVFSREIVEFSIKNKVDGSTLALSVALLDQTFNKIFGDLDVTK